MSKKTAVHARPIYADLQTVAAILSISDSTVQKLVREGSFPKPRQISPARVGWLIREIDEWAESRPVSDILPPRNCSAGRPQVVVQSSPRDRLQ